MLRQLHISRDWQSRTKSLIDKLMYLIKYLIKTLNSQHGVHVKLQGRKHSFLVGDVYCMRRSMYNYMHRPLVYAY